MIKVAKSKLLGFFAILMLVLNLTLITFIFVKKEHKPHFEGPKHIIAEKLDFDAIQIDAYDELIVEHRKEIFEIENTIIATKASLYQNLGENATANLDSLMDVLGDLQVSIEQTHYEHFQGIKDLCNEEQLPKFEALKDELAELFQHQRKKN